MKIVLIEDDVSACKKFIECANRRRDVFFAGITDNSDEGLEFVRTKLPEAVILDLELNWGCGSGTDFLKKLYNLELPIRPLIVVTTRNRSEIIQTQLHSKYGIEWIFCKEQSTYSAEMVIEQLLDLRPFLYKQKSGSPDLRTIETPEELEKRIRTRITAELNDFGISPKYKGRGLAEEAIYRLINKKNDKDSEKVFNELAVERGVHYNNIVRPIETAVTNAWNNPVDIERLVKVYTAPVRNDIGSPTPTEFIHFYADKIRKAM
jgi:CheY-like chemotaxis protein